MATQIVARRLSGGTGYQHIIGVGWIDATHPIQQYCTREEMVSYIDGGGSAFVADGAHRVSVVVFSLNGQRYLRTEADGVVTNNLLNLPNC